MDQKLRPVVRGTGNSAEILRQINRHRGPLSTAQWLGRPLTVRVLAELRTLAAGAGIAGVQCPGSRSRRDTPEGDPDQAERTQPPPRIRPLNTGRARDS